MAADKRRGRTRRISSRATSCRWFSFFVASGRRVDDDKFRDVERFAGTTRGGQRARARIPQDVRDRGLLTRLAARVSAHAATTRESPDVEHRRATMSDRVLLRVSEPLC